MPNLLMMRWVLGTAVALAAVLVLAIVWQSAGIGGVSGSPGVSGQRDFGRRQDELSFLQAAFDRLDAEGKQGPNGPALRSLRVQQESIMERMREVAQPLPPESLPRALRGLGKDEPRTASEPVLPKAPAETSGPTAPLALKVGLGASSAMPDLALARDPALNLVILIARPRPAREAASDNPAESRTATSEAKPAAKAPPAERAAEKAAARPPASGSAGFAEPPRSEPATASR
jgi:hypothetical protein